jgi:hypothetical protein
MIIFDDFDLNNIVNIESFNSSDVYNRIVLSDSNSGGMYIFVGNFGTAANVTFDVHINETRIFSGNLSPNPRAVANYINNKTELRNLGVTAQIIKNYIYGGMTNYDAIFIKVSQSHNDMLFIASPYYLVRSPLDYSVDIDNNKVRFVPQEYDPNILYAGILSDGDSELKYGSQILAPDLQFVGGDFYTYRSVVNNYLGFYNKVKQIMTIVVDYEMQNALPLDIIEVRLNINNIEKYMFMSNWEEVDSYVYKRFFLVGAGKLDHGVYKVKLKEI